MKISPRRCKRREGTGECPGRGSSNVKARTSLGHLRKNPEGWVEIRRQAKRSGTDDLRALEAIVLTRRCVFRKRLALMF